GAQARLLEAEVLTRDESIDNEIAIQQAMALLARIPDSDRKGAEARGKQGRLTYFVEHKPIAAERFYRRAIELDPEFVEYRYLCWKLLDLSGRSEYSEDLFWGLYERVSDADRPVLMREWYMSQFFQSTANPMADVLMGFKDLDKPVQMNPEYLRLKENRDSEPEEPANHAALARWFQHDGDHGTALALLEAGLKVRGADHHPFFLAVLLETLFERGELDRAKQYFQNWPEPHDGYDYWHWKGMLADEADRDYEAAIDAYDRSLAFWPGPVDWRTMNRKANCLARLRRADEAAAVRKRSKEIELQMDLDVHKELREALADQNLREREYCQKLLKFYQVLGREREVEGWQKVIDFLPAKSPGN
ncbi:MAG: hypothetical protein NT069_08990, partial [Planctomycetota bacterium]|nr:hypothetical protein [Planctomycetota bacterium]